MRCTVRERSLLPSQWTRNEFGPGLHELFDEEIRIENHQMRLQWQARHLRSELMMGAPMERLGTKCPSITSIWIRSAPARSASATCSPRRAKSAARMEASELDRVSRHVASLSLR